MLKFPPQRPDIMGMSRYNYDAKGTCFWIFPDGGEVSGSGVYKHDELLESLDGFEYNDDSGYENHGTAFDLGFLRITVATACEELNLQWASLLTGFQRKRATELLEGCSRVEIAGAEVGFDPQGDLDNLSLDVSDSTFRRLFAAGLRRAHSEWESIW